MQQLTPAQLHSLYKWIDSLPLNKVKKNIARDFSDGTLTAQLLHTFEPKLVDLHNYTATLAIAKKRDNWLTLNHKVLKKLGASLSNDEIESIIKGDKGAIERFLVQIQNVLMNQAEEKKRQTQQNEMTHSGNRSSFDDMIEHNVGSTQVDMLIQRIQTQEHTIVDQQQQIEVHLIIESYAYSKHLYEPIFTF